MIAEALGALWTREPGGTELGEAIRELCLGHRFDPSPRAEILLMAADRAEHVDKLICPTLEAGQHVVCDRYVNSTIAYQGAGRGMDIDMIVDVCNTATGGLVPDLVVVIAVSQEVAVARLAKRGDADRMESAGDGFHQRVRESYLHQNGLYGEVAVIDGDGTVDEVAERVRSAIRQRFAYQTTILT
jgi:dTMP kinase